MLVVAWRLKWPKIRVFLHIQNAMPRIKGKKVSTLRRGGFPVDLCCICFHVFCDINTVKIYCQTWKLNYLNRRIDIRKEEGGR